MGSYTTQDRWSSRKFWAAMFWELIFMIMRSMDTLPVDAFVSLTWLTLGGYFVGNVAQSWVMQHYGNGSGG